MDSDENGGFGVELLVRGYNYLLLLLRKCSSDWCHYHVQNPCSGSLDIC